MKKIILIALISFGFAGHSQEKQQQSYSFTLQEAITHALQYNYSEINAGRDIEAAKQKKWETTAAGLPQISGSVDYTNNIEPKKIVFGSIIFPAGTKHSLNANARLNQLLFDGSYIVALQASKTYLKYYENAKRKTDTDVKEMVISAYGNVLLAEESMAILEKNKATLTKTFTDTKETYKNGLIEEENVEQLQITLSSVESNLNNTKRTLDIAYKMVKIALGIDINDDLKLTDKLDALTISNLNMAFSQEAFDMANNVNYQIAENFKEQRRLEYKLEKSKSLPSLSSYVNFGYDGYSPTFTFTAPSQQWFNYSNLGVGLNVPIFTSFGRTAKIQQAKIAYEQAKTQFTESQQRLRLQYESARSEYEFSIEEYNTAKSNLNLAERIERKQQTKFTEGLSSSFDFSEAQRQLYSAQQDYLQSMVNIINKKATLETVINK